MHFILIFSLQILVLIAAIFLKLYVQKNDSGKLYRIGSNVILVIVHVMLAATIVHAVMHCCHGGCQKECHKKEMSCRVK